MQIKSIEIKTIENISKGEYREKGSRFIAIAYPVDSESGVKEIIARLWKEHFKARHICYAFVILTDEKESARANDDGEPSHTAGKPILNQINKYELKNVVVAVVRYFGGVLLGKGGLVRAYGTAAEESLKNASIVKFSFKTALRIKVQHAQYAQMLHSLYQFQHKILNEEFQDIATISVEVNKEDAERLITELSAKDCDVNLI